MHVPVSDQFSEKDIHEHDVVLDGIFGFSFKGEVRAPFDAVIKVRCAAIFSTQSLH